MNGQDRRRLVIWFASWKRRGLTIDRHRSCEPQSTSSQLFFAFSMPNPSSRFSLPPITPPCKTVCRHRSLFLFGSARGHLLRNLVVQSHVSLNFLRNKKTMARVLLVFSLTHPIGRLIGLLFVCVLASCSTTSAIIHVGSLSPHCFFCSKKLVGPGLACPGCRPVSRPHLCHHTLCSEHIPFSPIHLVLSIYPPT